MWQTIKAGANNLSAGLAARPELAAIILPGSVGGFVMWAAGDRPDNIDDMTPLAGMVLCMLLGGFAGIVLVGVITNTSRQDHLRLIGLTFLAGFAWPVIIAQGMRGLGADGTRVLDGLLEEGREIAGAAEAAVKGQDVPEVAELLQDVEEFAATLPAAGPVRDAALDATMARLIPLEEVQRQLAVDALRTAIEPNTGEELRLQAVREGLSAPPSVPVNLYELTDAPNDDEFLPAAPEVVTDERGRIAFTIDRTGVFQLETREPEATDLVALIYSARTELLVYSDDDSGSELNPRVRAPFAAGDYVIQLNHYGSASVASNVTVFLEEVTP